MSYFFSRVYLLMEVKSSFVFFMPLRKKWICKFAHGKCVAKMKKLRSNSGAKMVNAKFAYNMAFTIFAPDLHICLEQTCANPVFRPAASCKVPGKGTIVQLQINHL